MAGDAGAQALFEQQAFMAAGRFADHEVCMLMALEEGADRAPLVVDDMGGGAVGDGDGVLGDIETEAPLRLLMQAGHAGGILVRLRIVCGRGSASGPINSPSDGGQAGTLMTSGVTRS
ncbi:hypothetical protein [Mesorhizobium sp. LjNodule214]|uniref:hypothetical protein n=1 Tax=Mesorhizobium sp. LjNodule214 TaxID=3342252 RepID=UPI003ECFB7D7